MFKLLIELGPLLVFIVSYSYSNIFLASLLMVSVTVICLIISYIIDKKLSLPLLLSCLVLAIASLISWASGDARYIKMKPTIVYIIFGATLYIGAYNNKSFIKDSLKDVFTIPHKAWITLSKRLAYFLFSMAIVNEVVWRNFAESVWVKFKLFGAIPLSVFFILLQIPFVYSQRLNQVGAIDEN